MSVRKWILFICIDVNVGSVSKRPAPQMRHCVAMHATMLFYEQVD